MTPDFSPPLHRCLSEKEIQLECLFDGEIGSVVFHSLFILRPAPSLRLFSPPSGPSTPSDSFVCFLRFWGKDAGGLVSPQ